jgi:glucose 1-dehydrogenase
MHQTVWGCSKIYADEEDHIDKEDRTTKVLARVNAVLVTIVRQKHAAVQGDKMAGRLDGKVAVVTGSGSGIGQAIAERLALEGAHCVIDYVDHVEEADETADKIKAAGGKAVLVRADVSVVADCSRLIETAWSELGSCDVLVNNAGIEKSADFIDVTEQEYDAVLGVNLKGAFFLTQSFVRKLVAAKRPGRVINISSVHEDMVFPHFSTYCASKGAMRMLMRDLAVELGPSGITVNNIAPGAINTPINKSLLADKPKLDALLANIPLGRLGEPGEVAGVAAFLASDDGAYVTGSTYFIDGGLIRNYHEQ